MRWHSFYAKGSLTMDMKALYAEAEALSSADIQNILENSRRELSESWHCIGKASMGVLALLALLQQKWQQYLEGAPGEESYQLWADCKKLTEMMKYDLMPEVLHEIGESQPERFYITPEGDVYVIPLSLVSERSEERSVSQEKANFAPFVTSFQ